MTQISHQFESHPAHIMSEARPVMALDPGHPQPLVTIGLPVYNGADHLQLALDCLRGQSYRNIEIIVSDNGSTDGTHAICEMAARHDSRVKYHHHTHNRGPSWNFAFVLAQASGALFMWAGHDDIWDTDWISALARGFRKDTCVAFGRLRKLGPANGAQEDFPLLAFNGSKIIRVARYILSEEGRGKANLICGLYDTARLRERALPLLAGDWKIAGLDMLIVFRCLEKGNMVSVPSVWFYKRARFVESSNRGGAGLLKVLTMWDRLSYVWACLFIAEGLAAKAMVGVLLPAKYLQAAFWSLRTIVAGHR